MLFQYKAKSVGKGVVSGVQEAESKRRAARILRNEGLDLIELNEKVVGGGRRRKSRAKASNKELLIVLQQLTTLLKSGLSLEESVSSLGKSGQDSVIGNYFTGIAASLRKGESFSAALRGSKMDLPEYFYLLAEAGEMTGRLGDSLEDGVRQWTEEQKFTAELRGALTYPLLLIISGIVAVLIIFASVVPKFANLLDKEGADIPFLATAVLKTGTFVNQNFQMFGLAGVAFVFAGVYSWNNKNVRRSIYNLFSLLPFSRGLVLESAVYQWSAMLATLLGNRISLEKALELSQQCIIIDRLRTVMEQVVRGVRAGKTLSECLGKTDLISATGYDLVRVGEQSGKLPEMLRSMADILAESARNRTKQFLLLIEPLAIIVIGIITGVIMAGIILAITSVNDITL